MMRYVRSLVSGAIILLVAIALVFALRPQATQAPAAAVGPSGWPTDAAREGALVFESLVPLAPAVSPKPIDSECRHFAEIVDRVPPTIEAMARRKLTIVAGTVTDVGPGQWNTENAEPPASVNDLYPYDVIRLLRISTDASLAGDIAGPLLTIWVPGGSIGCSEFINSDAPSNIESGQRFVLFLDRVPLRNGLANVDRAVQLWSIGGSDLVSTPEDGAMSVAELVSRLNTAGSTSR